MAVMMPSNPGQSSTCPHVETTMRPPWRVTRAISARAAEGVSMNMSPKLQAMASASASSNGRSSAAPTTNSASGVRSAARSSIDTDGSAPTTRIHPASIRCGGSTPVPQATSNTVSPPSPSSAATRAAQGSNMAGTRMSSYASAAPPTK